MEQNDYSLKLTKQLIELKRCNAEIEEIFHDLDDVNISQSLSESSEEDHSISFNNQNETLNSYSCSCSCNESNSSEDLNESYSFKKKPKIQKQKEYRPARISFKYKLPRDTEFKAQSCFNINDLLESVTSDQNSPLMKQNIKNTKPNRSNSVNNKQIPKEKKNNFSQIISKPTWVPNGQFKRSSSTQNINIAPLSRQSSNLTVSSLRSNPKLTTPWRPNGKLNNELTVYSHEFIRSVEVPQKNKLTESKDIGKGWKFTNKIETKNDLIKVKEPVKLSKSQEIVKKVKLKDDKDIGDGWKPNGKTHSQPEYKTDTDIIKEPIKESKKEPVKQKDIGKGWKPGGKLKQSEFIYESKDLKEETKEVNKPVKQNIGTAWKPTGQTKIKNKNLLDTNIFHKPPIVEQSNKIDLRKTVLVLNANKWKPAVSRIKTSFPNTWTPNSKKTKPAIKNQLKQTKLDEFMTSTPKEATPNMTNLKLEESMIETKKDDKDNLSGDEKLKNLELDENIPEPKINKSINSSRLNDKIDPNDLEDEEEVKNDDKINNEEDIEASIKPKSENGSENIKQNESIKQDSIKQPTESDLNKTELDVDKKSDSEDEIQAWNNDNDDDDE